MPQKIQPIIYLLACAAEDNESAVERFVKAIQGWVDCFEKAEFSAQQMYSLIAKNI